MSSQCNPLSWCCHVFVAAFSVCVCGSARSRYDFMFFLGFQTPRLSISCVGLATSGVFWGFFKVCFHRAEPKPRFTMKHVQTLTVLEFTFQLVVLAFQSSGSFLKLKLNMVVSLYELAGHTFIYIFQHVLCYITAPSFRRQVIVFVLQKTFHF